MLLLDHVKLFFGSLSLLLAILTILQTAAVDEQDFFFLGVVEAKTQ